MTASTTPAREPVVEVHPNHLRFVGVRLSDAELIVLRNIAERMKGMRLPFQDAIEQEQIRQYAERFLPVQKRDTDPDWIDEVPTC
ncbi:hypothetical protein [Burkholderia cenocepacia]|uniref:hypothetical protein n=1 Tax=Burkholderia cenocepacia TaxID=95486 RepID=UPI001904E1AC|nr:hypothetical protein [Burkholderia cenocepacia]MBJ9695737.1 hypothetical protein [Burkholderia cenocepacia]